MKTLSFHFLPGVSPHDVEAGEDLTCYLNGALLAVARDMQAKLQTLLDADRRQLIGRVRDGGSVPELGNELLIATLLEQLEEMTQPGCRATLYISRETGAGTLLRKGRIEAFRRAYKAAQK